MISSAALCPLELASRVTSLDESYNILSSLNPLCPGLLYRCYCMHILFLVAIVLMQGGREKIVLAMRLDTLIFLLNILLLHGW